MGPAGQKVCRFGFELPCRASGQKKAEATGISVVQILDFVQEGRNFLNLVHTYDSRGPFVGLQDLCEDVGVSLKIQPCSPFLEVEDPGIRVRQSLQQRGFSGLPRSEQQANFVPGGLGLQYAFEQSRINHDGMYNIPDILHVNENYF
jgi:hypothetical protein